MTIDKTKIKSTYERVEESLNLRFQKEGSFFISKEDLESLKKSIYKEELQNVIALETKVGAVIVLQVILKHPWLVSNSLIKKKEFKHYLEEKFENISDVDYMDHLKMIVNDQIFSTLIFKEYLEPIYYSRLSIKECQKICKDPDQKPKVLAYVFKRLIIASDSSLRIKLREIDEMFNSNPTLYNEVCRLPYLNEVVQAVEDEDKKKSAAQWILERKIKKVNEVAPVWARAFYSLRHASFLTLIENIEDDFDYESNKWLIRTALPQLFRMEADDEDIESYKEDVVAVYARREAYRIRVLFLEMLKPSKFPNKELAMSLFDEFEEIGLPSAIVGRRASEIKEWTSHQKGFTDHNEAFDQMQSLGYIIKSDTLLHYASRLRQTNAQVILNLYESYNNVDGVRLCLTYYMARELSFNRTRLIAQIDEITRECIDQVTAYIDEYSFRSQEIETFLHENGKFSVLEKITKR